MAMTEVEKNYSFHDETMKDLQVLVTNNTDRTLEHNELVYLDGYFGEVVEIDGIAAAAEGYINIYPFRTIRTTQVADAQDFTPGDVVWFAPQTSGAGNNGELLDDAPNPVVAQVAVGTILAGGDSGYVIFRPFIQDIDFSLIKDDGGLIAACVATTAAMKGGGWTDETIKGNADDIETLEGRADDLEDRADLLEVNPLRMVALVVDEAAHDTHLAFPNAETGLGVGDVIVDVHIVCTDNDSTHTLALYQMADGPILGNAISSAMACTTVNALARTVSIDQDENVVTADGLAVVGGAAPDRGIVYVTYIKATA